jgi:hypothetical protein
MLDVNKQMENGAILARLLLSATSLSPTKQTIKISINGQGIKSICNG